MIRSRLISSTSGSNERTPETPGKSPLNEKQKQQKRNKTKQNKKKKNNNNDNNNNNFTSKYNQ